MIHFLLSRRGQKPLAICIALFLAASGPLFSESLFRDSAVVKLHGQRIGTFIRTFERDKGQIRSEIRFQMKVKRFGEVIEMNRIFSCVEDEEGIVQSFRLVNRQSQIPSELSGKRDGEEFIIEKSSGTSRTTLRRPVPADTVSPWKAYLEDKSRQLATGLVYTQRVFSVNTEDDMTDSYSMEVAEAVKYSYGGKSVDAFVVMATPQPGGTAERHVVAQGGIVFLQEMPGTGTSIEKVEEADLAESETTDIFELLAVKIEGKIRFPRDARRVAMEISSDRALPHIEQTDYQAVDRRTKGGRDIISVRAVRRQPSQIFQALPENAFLQAEESIDPADPEIVKLAETITRGSPDALSKIRKINQWVFENIKKKDYSVGYASASEVARNLQGDCTEHSVLFIALARAAGVPARIVLGLAYMNDPSRGPAFVMHQWAEAYSGGWIPVDPTFGLLPADAARIVISRPVPGERKRANAGIMEWGPHIRVKIISSR
jgi:predicted transglutaminase-like cysteine proteinase